MTKPKFKLAPAKIELPMQALAQFDAETHFLARAQRGASRVERARRKNNRHIH